MLPSHTGSKNNGISYSFFANVNVKVLLSLIWLIVSVILFFTGVYHCNSYSYHYTFDCDQAGCNYHSSKTNENIYIEKKDLRHTSNIRINENGEVEKISNIGTLENKKKKKSSRLGYSVEVSYYTHQDSTTAEKKLLLSPEDMGRSYSKSSTNKLYDYIVAKKLDKVSISASRSVTIVGIICMCFGAFSTMLSLIAGQWKEDKKMMKKSR